MRSYRIPVRCAAPVLAYTGPMNRIFWAGVGAAGGIYVYRKSTQTYNAARDRTWKENLSTVARHASNVAASARYLAQLSGSEEQAAVVDLHSVPGGRR